MLFLGALWFDGGEAVWRGCGVAALLALCGSHASLVLQARRPTDTRFIDTLVMTSIGAAALDTLVGTAAATGTVDDVGGGFVRLAAVVLVVMLLTTALVPLLRRLGAIRSLPRPDAFGRRTPPQGSPLTLEQMTAEVASIVGRPETAQAPAAVAREAQALRDLIARAETREP